jgi:hypothetical protein
VSYLTGPVGYSLDVNGPSVAFWLERLLPTRSSLTSTHWSISAP